MPTPKGWTAKLERAKKEIIFTPVELWSTDVFKDYELSVKKARRRLQKLVEETLWREVPEPPSSPANGAKERKPAHLAKNAAPKTKSKARTAKGRTATVPPKETAKPAAAGPTSGAAASSSSVVGGGGRQGRAAGVAGASATGREGTSTEDVLQAVAYVEAFCTIGVVNISVLRHVVSRRREQHKRGGHFHVERERHSLILKLKNNGGEKRKKLESDNEMHMQANISVPDHNAMSTASSLFVTSAGPVLSSLKTPKSLLHVFRKILFHSLGVKVSTRRKTRSASNFPEED